MCIEKQLNLNNDENINENINNIPHEIENREELISDLINENREELISDLINERNEISESKEQIVSYFKNKTYKVKNYTLLFDKYSYFSGTINPNIIYFFLSLLNQTNNIFELLNFLVEIDSIENKKFYFCLKNENQYILNKDKIDYDNITIIYNNENIVNCIKIKLNLFSSFDNAEETYEFTFPISIKNGKYFIDGIAKLDIFHDPEFESVNNYHPENFNFYTKYNNNKLESISNQNIQLDDYEYNNIFFMNF